MPSAGEQRRRILVVEDDAANRLLLKAALSKDGFDVETLSRGREVVERVKAWRPHLVVLDLGLGDLDGYEVMRRLGAAGQRVPVIVVTGRSNPSDRVLGLDAGAEDYIVKPYNIDEMRARVRAVMRRHYHAVKGNEDLRRFLGLRAWPLSLAVVFATMALLAQPFEGLPGAEAYTDVMSWCAAATALCVAARHSKGLRYLHVFFSFGTAMVRSMFALIAWTNAPDGLNQLFGAAVWGSVALAIVTIYLLTLPYVVDEQIEKTLAVA